MGEGDGPLLLGPEALSSPCEAHGLRQGLRPGRPRVSQQKLGPVWKPRAQSGAQRKHSVKITTFSRCSSSSSGFISPHSSSSPIFPGSQLEDVVPPTIPRGYNSYHPMSPPTNTGTQAKMAERRRESTVRKANLLAATFKASYPRLNLCCIHPSPLPPSPRARTLVLLHLRAPPFGQHRPACPGQHSRQAAKQAGPTYQ